MRKTWRSRKVLTATRFNSLADSRSCPNGFSMITRVKGPPLSGSVTIFSLPRSSEITGKNDGGTAR